MLYSEVMRTTVDVPEPLLENAKKRASVLGVTVSVVIQDALRSHLARTSGSTAGASATGNFHLHTVSGKLVHPELDLDRTSALLALEDEADYSHQRD